MPEWDLLSSKGSGLSVDVVKVDCEQSDLGELKIWGYPTLLLVHGDRKWEFDQAASTTSVAMIEFAKAQCL